MDRPAQCGPSRVLGSRDTQPAIRGQCVSPCVLGCVSACRSRRDCADEQVRANSALLRLRPAARRRSAAGRPCRRRRTSPGPCVGATRAHRSLGRRRTDRSCGREADVERARRLPPRHERGGSRPRAHPTTERRVRPRRPWLRVLAAGRASRDPPDRHVSPPRPRVGPTSTRRRALSETSPESTGRSFSSVGRRS